MITRFAIALLLTVPSLASSQAPEGSRTESELRLFPSHYENFFQAPDGAPKKDVDAMIVEARVTHDLGRAKGWRSFLAPRYTVFRDDFEDSPAVRFGFQFDDRPHAADIDLRYERDRPAFDIGDEFDQADVLALAAEYGWRFTDAWELGLLGGARHQEFDNRPDKENDLVTAGVSLRYRGWGYGFSPEVGLEAGRRDIDNANQVRDVTQLWIKIRSLATENLYLTLRYRRRLYEYTVDDPLESNFDREDDRDQWTLSANYSLMRRLSLQAYYDYVDADSDKPSRIFTTQRFGVGTTVHF